MTNTIKTCRRSGVATIAASMMFLMVACSGGGSSADSSQPENVQPNTPASPAKGDVINGIWVPPLPDPIANNTTLAGIDSNSNGIRDDVERILVTEFGNNAEKYKEAIIFAQSEQNLAVHQDEAAVQAYIHTVACTPLKSIDTDKLTYAAFNTPERGQAYGLLAGKGALECK